MSHRLLGPLTGLATCLLLAHGLPAQSTPGASESRAFLMALSVPSVEATVAWYTRHLGFRVATPASYRSPGLGSALLELNGFYLEIVSVPGARPRASALPDPTTNGSLQGPYKFGLWVSDLDSTLAALRAADIVPYRPPGVAETLPGAPRYALIRDLDGTVVQLFGPSGS